MNIHPSFSGFIASALRAILRARGSILTIAAVYIVSILVGILMVHSGNAFALKQRDQIVNQAIQSSPITGAANQGNNLKAAVLDFGGNLVLGAVPKTIGGLGIVFAYPFVAYQGWIGGIVSVRGDRTSRFNEPRPAFYYLLTLVLQVIPYSLAIGAGVNAGVALFRPATYYQGEKLFGLYPKEALWDIARIYAIAAPIFLIASLWEFLSPWNF